MNPRQIEPLTVRGEEQTLALAASLGRLAGPGTLIGLVGPLGAGKTRFVQGLAAGLDVPAGVYVNSPSFTIINEYPGRLTLYHLDLFRVQDPDELELVGYREICFGDAVAVVEWMDLFDDAFGEERLVLRIDYLDAPMSRLIRAEAIGEVHMALLADWLEVLPEVQER